MSDSIFRKHGLSLCDYRYFADKVENYFYPYHVVLFDEYGLPMQVGIKLSETINFSNNIDEAINQLKEYAKLDYTPVVDQRAVKFQENYLTALNEMQFTIAQSGITDEEYNEVVDLLNQIREIVERQTPEHFYIAQITVPNAAMQVVSGRVLLAHTIALVLRSWEIFDKQH